MPTRLDDREGERRQATVVFADIAGFTAMSEKLDPEEVHLLDLDTGDVIRTVALPGTRSPWLVRWRTNGTILSLNHRRHLRIVDGKTGETLAVEESVFDVIDLASDRLWAAPLRRGQ